MFTISKIQDLLASGEGTSLSDLVEALKPILLEQLESISVLSSSSNLLNFYVNDIIDLAMINNGKFRKNCANFSVRDAVEEVMAV